MEMLESGLPEHVAADEDLARFLIQSNQFNTQVVKPAAFMPNPKDRETSVSRQQREPSAALWEAGLQAAGGRTLYGAAFVKAQEVRDAGLEVTAAEPPPCHAVITGWPWPDDTDMQRAQQKEFAIVLASVAGKPLFR